MVLLLGGLAGPQEWSIWGMMFSQLVSGPFTCQGLTTAMPNKCRYLENRDDKRNNSIVMSHVVKL